MAYLMCGTFVQRLERASRTVSTSGYLLVTTFLIRCLKPCGAKPSFMFDSVCKFLVETFPTDFATWLLGESITLIKLSPSELSLEPIRADALILRQSEQVVVHIEFQTEPNADIPFRMLDYRTRVYRRFPQKRMY